MNYKRISPNESRKKLSSIRDTFVPTRKRWCSIRPIVDDDIEVPVIYIEGGETAMKAICLVAAKREAIERPSGPGFYRLVRKFFTACKLHTIFCSDRERFTFPARIHVHISYRPRTHLSFRPIIYCSFFVCVHDHFFLIAFIERGDAFIRKSVVKEAKD